MSTARGVEDLEAAAARARTDEAMAVGWYVDLSTGSGAAERVDAGVRLALSIMTATRALELGGPILAEEHKRRQDEAALKEAERKRRAELQAQQAAERAKEARQRRVDMVLRALFVAYVVGGYVLFSLQWQRALTAGDIYDTVVFVYPLPFGVVGGILSKKLLDPHDRFGIWQFVVIGVLLWLFAVVASLSIVRQELG